MKQAIRAFAVMAAVAIFAIASFTQASAQHSHAQSAQRSWKKGMVRLISTAWAGNTRLKEGMYHVRHIVKGDKHWLVFKEVGLRSGYLGGRMWEGREIARIECRVEPVEKSVRNTKVTLAKVDGIRLIEEIQIAGEHVRHVLMNTSSPSRAPLEAL